MTREQQLVFCKKCLNRKFDMQQGLLCGLTGEKANFENECPDFKLDEEAEAKERAKQEEAAAEAEPLGMSDVKEKLSSEAFQKLQMEQNLIGAISAGLVAGLMGAILWAVVTVFTGYQIGYMAIGIGALVGFGIRIFGRGVDQIFGFTGAIISLVSALLGNILSVVGFAAQYYEVGYFEALSSLDLGVMIELLQESFSPIDLVFYGLAVYAGYQLSFRSISEEEIAEMNQ